MPKSKLNYRGLFDQVRFVMKTKQDNDMTDHVGAIYAKNDNEQSWLIRLSVACNEN